MMVHTRPGDVRRSCLRLMVVRQPLLGRNSKRGIYSRERGSEIDDMLVGGSTMVAIGITNQPLSGQPSYGSAGANYE